MRCAVDERDVTGRLRLSEPALNDIYFWTDVYNETPFMQWSDVKDVISRTFETRLENDFY